MNLEIIENFSLKEYNTFGVDVRARYFIAIQNEGELVELFSTDRFSLLPKLILGGGSNVLFTKDFEGLVIFINIKGIEYEKKNDLVQVNVAGGEVWNDLVQFCVKEGFGGVENLSLIPGTVGASPVQNIGAYGVELQDVFLSCRAFDTKSKIFVKFKKEDCQFSYRSSIFKQEAKARYIIVSVTLELRIHAVLNTSYGAIEAELQHRAIEKPTIKDIAHVVSDIRVKKLPDPATIGNAGSFFKNPLVEISFFRQLKSNFVDIVYFPIDDGYVKLAAGWLIDHCGWKGVRVGNTGTWKNQALVLVNYGNATGSEIYELSEAIISSVYTKFGIKLEREVNII